MPCRLRLLALLVVLGEPLFARPGAEARPNVKASDWWKHAVFYEVYPRSFADSNNDGIGDLPGIAGKIPYLRDLGIDAIWITPCFPSPQVDFGYDVSDYLNVDPVYGTLADLDHLVAQARDADISVVLDLVLNHTSDHHPWFSDSRSSRQATHRNWYIWRDGKDTTLPPNNWLSLFGGRAWTYDGGTGAFLGLVARCRFTRSGARSRSALLIVVASGIDQTSSQITANV